MRPLLVLFSSDPGSLSDWWPVLTKQRLSANVVLLDNGVLCEQPSGLVAGNNKIVSLLCDMVRS